MSGSGGGSSRSLRLATRGSPLALAQARIVSDLIRAAGDGSETELVVVETAGDQRQSVPIHQVGGQGIFVKEVEAAVLDGRADAAIHSAKDLPASGPGSASGDDPLRIVAVPERSDPRDALVGSALAALAPGARVATGSVRRRAQLAWLRPDLMFCELRGNIATRMSKVPDGGSIVVAMAALVRLGLSGDAAEVLSVATMLPQVGQGTIAVCARPDDERAASLLGPVEHGPSRVALDAERAYLAGIGGGCDLPVGAYATVTEGGSIELEAMIASLDGHVIVREAARGDEPHALGAELARHVLDEAGGRALMSGFGVSP